MRAPAGERQAWTASAVRSRAKRSPSALTSFTVAGSGRLDYDGARSARQADVGGGEVGLQDFSAAFALAFGLIFEGDRDLFAVVLLSLRVSLSAVLLACAIGLPAGAALAVRRFPGRGAILVVLNAMMGLPPVVVGLLLYLLLSNAGPLGTLQLLYTPVAMILAQTVLVTPIVAALTRQVIEDLHQEYDEQLRSFGVRGLGLVQTLLWDARYSLLTVALAGFGRAIAEVGAVIIVGGNINEFTRVMTTTIALETSRGNLALALALGVILMTLAILVSAVVMGLKATAARSAYA
jgi:tungstate transport system permease protein